MISSRTVLSPSRVVPWAVERVNAVNPPKRSEKFPQNRSIPNTKSSATVMTAEISREPKQPRRFEKNKNKFAPSRRIGMRG